MAVVVGVGRLLAPQAEALKPHLETALAQSLGASVRIEGLTVQWPGVLPSMTLTGLAIERDGATRVELDEAVVEFHWLNAFKSDEVVTHLALVAPELVVAEQTSGEWTLLWSDEALPPTSSPPPAGDAPPSMALLNQWPDWLGFSLRAAQLTMLPIDQDTIGVHLAEVDFVRAGQRFRLTGWLAAAENAPEQVQFRVALARTDERWSSAAAWVDAQDVSLSYWLSEMGYADLLPVDTLLSAEAWVSWNELEGARLDADAQLTGPHGVLDSQWKARRWPVDGERAWAVELRELDLNGQSALRALAVGVTPEAYAMALERADLAAVHRALEPWLAPLAAWPDELSGRVEGLVLGLDERYRAHEAGGTFEALTVAYDDPERAIAKLTGGLALSGDQVALNLDGPLSVVWPEAVRGNIELSGVNGQVLISPDRLQLNQVQATSEHFDVTVHGSVYRQPSRPFIDLWVDASRIEAFDVRPLLPYKGIPAPAMRWLDEALVNIGQATGHALLHFPVGLKTPQFTPGHLSAAVSFSGVDMAYARNWPMATDLVGEVEFSGQALTGSVSRGRVEGLVLSAPRVHIGQLSDAVVELDLQGAGISANALASALGRLPFPGWSDVFDSMDWTGELASEVSIQLPVKARDRWVIDGGVSFDGNAVAFENAGVSLNGLAGAIEFDRQLIRSRDLVGTFDGQQVELDTTIDFDPRARVNIQTSLDVADWFAAKPWGHSLADWFEGPAKWSIDLAPSQEGEGLALRISSDLTGLAINLPAPFNKPADAAWPLELTQVTSGSTRPWKVTLDERWQAAIRSQDGAWSMAVHANQGDQQGPMAMPEQPGLWVRGALDELDIDAWRHRLQRSMAAEAEDGRPMAAWVSEVFANEVDAELAIDELSVAGLVPDRVDLKVGFADAQWVLAANGPSVAGEIVWPVGEAFDRAVVVDLARAKLLTSPPESDDAPINAPSSMDPRKIRPLTLFIESLAWGDLELGQVRLETHRTMDGLELELVDVDGPDLRLQAQGQWIQPPTGEPRSLMSGRLSSRNFNQLIQATGYQAGLRARQASVNFELDWPGAPLDFNLFRVAGGLEFDIGGGNIPQASAGAGRLLGLVSFNALPRRLMLDFRDVFSAGFPFDGIEGEFDMQAGMARTDGVKIASPAAVLTLTGNTDMIARTYDQSLVIEPGLGSTLPVIGGLAGGPVGAAAGLLLRTILNQPLKGVSMARYTIQGPWSDPAIELVDAEVADAEDDALDTNAIEGPLPPPTGDGSGQGN